MKRLKIISLFIFSLFAINVFPSIHDSKGNAAAINWLPYNDALAAAKQANKPMFVFMGAEYCKDCQKFLTDICTQDSLIEYLSQNMICTKVMRTSTETVDIRLQIAKIADTYNIPSSHAVIIVNNLGKRIGEISTTPSSIKSFIENINGYVAKSIPEGRLKYCDVDMIDKIFVPDKTYPSSEPQFTDNALTGRYINLMTVVRVQSWENTRARSHGQTMERDRNTPAIALKMRESLAAAYPAARMTWSWSWQALNDTSSNYTQLRKLMLQFVTKYGDEMTYIPGVYFADKFNTVEQAKKDLHEGLELVSKMVGNGYRPKSVIAGHMSVEGMKYLAENENIHVVQGQIWSQFGIDGQDGDGGIIYPYYPSKDHFLKPAQGTRDSADFVDMVNVDGWTVDFFAARKRGSSSTYNSRVGVGPIETHAYYGYELGLREMMYVTDDHFNDSTVANNGFGFITVNWELTLFQWLDPNYLPNYIRSVRAKYLDVQMLTLGDFGEKWRAHNQDNSKIDLKFVEKAHEMPSLEEGKKIVSNYNYHPEIFKIGWEINWYFNRDFRFATIQDVKGNGEKLVMDYTRYNQPYKEPSGNVIERHWDILDIINQKQSRPQDVYIPFSQLPVAEQQKILKRYPTFIGTTSVDAVNRVTKNFKAYKSAGSIAIVGMEEPSLVEVFNVNGLKVFSKVINNGNIPFLVSGVYIAKCKETVVKIVL